MATAAFRLTTLRVLILIHTISRFFFPKRPDVLSDRTDNTHKRMYVAGHTAYFFCHVKMSHVARCIAAGRKKLEIRYVLSELDDFAVALINRNRAFDFSPESRIKLTCTHTSYIICVPAASLRLRPQRHVHVRLATFAHSHAHHASLSYTLTR